MVNVNNVEIRETIREIGPSTLKYVKTYVDDILTELITYVKSIDENDDQYKKITHITYYPNGEAIKTRVIWGGPENKLFKQEYRGELGETIFSIEYPIDDDNGREIIKKYNYPESQFSGWKNYCADGRCIQTIYKKDNRGIQFNRVIDSLNDQDIFLIYNPDIDELMEMDDRPDDADEWVLPDYDYYDFVIYEEA